MSSKSFDGSVAATKLTIERYLDVLVSLKPSEFFAQITPTGAIQILEMHSQMAQSPIEIVFKCITGRALVSTAAFWIPEVEVAFGWSQIEVLSVRCAEFGYRHVGLKKDKTDPLRARIERVMMPLFVQKFFIFDSDLV